MSEYTVEIEIPPLDDGTCSNDCFLANTDDCFGEAINCRKNWAVHTLNDMRPGKKCPRYKDLP